MHQQLKQRMTEAKVLEEAELGVVFRIEHCSKNIKLSMSGGATVPSFLRAKKGAPGPFVPFADITAAEQLLRFHAASSVFAYGFPGGPNCIVRAVTAGKESRDGPTIRQDYMVKCVNTKHLSDAGKRKESICGYSNAQETIEAYRSAPLHPFALQLYTLNCTSAGSPCTPGHRGWQDEKPAFYSSMIAVVAANEARAEGEGIPELWKTRGVGALGPSWLRRYHFHRLHIPPTQLNLGYRDLPLLLFSPYSSLPTLIARKAFREDKHNFVLAWDVLLRIALKMPRKLQWKDLFSAYGEYLPDSVFERLRSIQSKLPSRPPSKRYYIVRRRGKGYIMTSGEGESKENLCNVWQLKQGYCGGIRHTTGGYKAAAPDYVLPDLDTDVPVPRLLHHDHKFERGFNHNALGRALVPKQYRDRSSTTNSLGRLPGAVDLQRAHSLPRQLDGRLKKSHHASSPPYPSVYLFFTLLIIPEGLADTPISIGMDHTIVNVSMGNGGRQHPAWDERDDEDDRDPGAIDFDSGDNDVPAAKLNNSKKFSKTADSDSPSNKDSSDGGKSDEEKSGESGDEDNPLGSFIDSSAKATIMTTTTNHPRTVLRFSSSLLSQSFITPSVQEGRVPTVRRRLTRVPEARKPELRNSLASASDLPLGLYLAFLFPTALLSALAALCCLPLPELWCNWRLAPSFHSNAIRQRVPTPSLYSWLGDISNLMSAEACSGIPINTDISGPGVRSSSYLQAGLTIILVCVSPEDAPTAYWSMSAAALGLVITSLVTALLEDISLLDAIVVTYVLILPVVASTYGIANLSSPQAASGRGPTNLRRIHSPLLILTHWLRSAFTYVFALFLWVKAPNFGSGPPECDQATRFIFFWASMPALGTGRWLNLIVWGVSSGLFAWRTYKGAFTLLASMRGLLMKDDTMFRPKGDMDAEIVLESRHRYTYHTGEHEHQARSYSPGQVVLQILQGMMSLVVGMAPTRRYMKYGQLAIVIAVAGWAIAMTELELKRNVLEVDVNSTWGYGQVLPLILTISPLFSLWEALYKRNRGAGVVRKLRFCVVSARGLKRNSFPEPGSGDGEGMPQDQPEANNSPSPFVVVTIDKTEFYSTFYHDNTENPTWKDSFDIEVTDTTTMEIRVFDAKAMNDGKPALAALIGYTVIAPFTMLYPGQGVERADTRLGQQAQASGTTAEITTTGPTAEGGLECMEECMTIAQVFPLMLDGEVIPGATLTFSVSKDVGGPPPLPDVPSRYGDAPSLNRTTRVENWVGWQDRRVGHEEETSGQVYLPNPSQDDSGEIALDETHLLARAAN
ncbi:hypothetical protein NMY22_g16033 [Coprinellus aureogranulatus]|nr:hypothetical protein NMY22_g16033 [Coprinellus aureogranulatus]